MIRRTFQGSFVPCLVALTIGIAAPASAQDERAWTWRGGAGQWTNNHWDIVGPDTASREVRRIDGNNASASTVTLSHSVTLSTLAISTGDELVVDNGLVTLNESLHVDGTLRFVENGHLRTSASLAGSGEIVVDNFSWRKLELTASESNPLHIGESLTVRGWGQVGFYSGVTNEGLVVADQSGLPLHVYGAYHNAAGAVMKATGGGTLQLNGTWTNAGTLQVDTGSTLELNGIIRDVGTIVRGPGATEVKLLGVFSRQGGVQRLDAGTGSWTFAGSISDTILEFADGATLRPTGLTGSATRNGLYNVQIGSDWNIDQPGGVTVFEKLTVQPGKTVTLGAGVQVHFDQRDGLSTLGGGGEVVLAGTAENPAHLTTSPFSLRTLEIEAGTTVRGRHGRLYSGGIGDIINHGIMDADTADAGFVFETNLNNTGTLRASAGYVKFVGGRGLRSSGTVEISGGSLSGTSWLTFLEGARLKISLDELTTTPLTAAGFGLSDEDYLELLGGTPGQTYTIATAIGHDITDVFEHVTPGYDVTYLPRSITVTVLPEPTSAALLLLGAAVARRRPSLDGRRQRIT